MMSLLVLFYRIFVFALGASFGVILALWTLSLSNTNSNNYSTLYNPHSDPVTDSKNYNHWLQTQGISKVAQVKTSCSKNGTLESDFLKQHIKITCVILIDNLESAYRVYSSWVNRCDSFYFFGAFKNTFISIITSTHSKFPWQRLCKSLEYLILNERKHLQWIILVKDNTFVIPENLRYSLALLNSTEPFYGGQIKSHRNILYSSLNTGIVLNVVALEYLLQNNCLPCYLQNFYDPDYFLGRQLFNHGIYPKSLLDRNKCSRFHSFSFIQMFSSHIHNSHRENHDLAAGVLKDETGFCYSNTSITFKMPLLSNKETLESVYYYMLYQFRLTPGCYSANQYLSPPVSSAQDWAKSITMYTNKTEDEVISMSDEEYYILWKNISLQIPVSW